MSGMRYLVNLRVGLVVLAGVVKHQHKIRLALLQGRVSVLLNFRPDFFKINRPLDDLIIIRKLFEIGQPEKNERQLAAFAILVIAERIKKLFEFFAQIPRRLQRRASRTYSD